MYMAFAPRVVVTIHGIQTRGRWQKEITPYLAKYALIPYHIDFGWFDVFRFLFPCTREKQFNQIRTELRALAEKVGTGRISVIAHSFGTYLAMEALVRDNGDLLYDKVVLTGCILPTDFDWSRVLAQKKLVLAVRNERATKDWVVALCDWTATKFPTLVRIKAGRAGLVGFKNRPTGLIDFALDGGHSETHNALKYEQWARFIAYPILPSEVLEKVRKELGSLRQTVANMLDDPVDLIRVNLFAPINGCLRIVPGATDNMDFAPEYSLAIEPGHGATGFAFQAGKPTVVVKRQKSWTGSSLPPEELKKINPKLQWVISTPLKNVATKSNIGVINVDGMRMSEKISNTNIQTYLMITIGTFCEQRIQPYLELAYRGEMKRPLEI